MGDGFNRFTETFTHCILPTDDDDDDNDDDNNYTDKDAKAFRQLYFCLICNQKLVITLHSRNKCVIVSFAMWQKVHLKLAWNYQAALVLEALVGIEGYHG